MIGEEKFSVEGEKEIYIELKTGDNWNEEERKYREEYKIEFSNMDMKEATDHGIDYNYFFVGADIETAKVVLGFARDRRKEIKDPYILYREIEDFYKQIKKGKES